jgi:predicted MPP superfamily phosphohydrolase
MQLYVSCGTGYWGPPMRLGAPAEVTKVVLTPG